MQPTSTTQPTAELASGTQRALCRLLHRSLCSEFVNDFVTKLIPSLFLNYRAALTTKLTATSTSGSRRCPLEGVRIQGSFEHSNNTWFCC